MKKTLPNTIDKSCKRLRFSDFEKEKSIQEISRILRSWPSERIRIVLAAVRARESGF